MKKYIWVMVFTILFGTLQAQTEESLIRATIMNYIDGTSYSKIDLIEKAFYKDANLYLTNRENNLWVVPSTEYIGFFKKGEPGKFTGRIGNILSIDRDHHIAIAKVEILVPARKTRYVDNFLMKKVDGDWKIMSKSATSTASNKFGDRILFIVSNAHYYGKSNLQTGNSFAEIVNAYHTFDSAGYTVDFVSPEGGAIPLAYISTSDELQKKYLYDTDFMFAIKNTQAPATINSANYKAVHYIGGGSAMFDVPTDPAIQTIAMKVYEENNGIISSVCHGTAGIVHLKTSDGKYLVDGKRVNGYPEAFERKDADYFKQFPFLIQKTIEEHGGTFKYVSGNTPYVEVDGRLVTGQNYLSSVPVAEKIIELLTTSKTK